jgi:hypothetical protein
VQSITQTSAEDAGLPHAESQDVKTHPHAERMASGEAVAGQKQFEPGKQPAEEPAYADIALTQDEIEFMKRLSALVGSTPRAVKRYINIYRLLRARVPKERLSEFLGNSGEPREYEAVMLLIGIYYIDAELARALAIALEEASSVEGARTPIPFTEFLTRFKVNNVLSGKQSTVIEALTDYCEEFADTPKKPTVEPFGRWYLVVGRYSFCGELIS